MCALPLAALVVLLVVLLGAGAGSQPLPPGCGAGGTATTVGTVTLDPEQMSHAQTIVTVTAGRHLPVYAAVIAVATAYQESKLRNILVQLDHDSEGLFQLRVGLWGKQTADNPVLSTAWFLDRLVRVPNWHTLPLTVVAQAVQRSAYPDAYARWQPLAAGIVGQLWPTAAAATAHSRDWASPGTSDLMPTAVLCPAVGDGIPASTGDTAVPAGLIVAGSPAGITAVRSALAQLGKPYRWGAAGPDTFDCSGLTMAAWATAGLALPHFTGDQVTRGTPRPTNLTQAVAGDLVFIPGSLGTPSAPRHVGMVAGFLAIAGAGGRRLLIVHAPRAGENVQLIDASRWAGLVVAVRHLA